MAAPQFEISLVRCGKGWKSKVLPHNFGLSGGVSCLYGFGALDVTEPYEFIGFGALDVAEPYKCIGFGAPGGPGEAPDGRFSQVKRGFGGPSRGRKLERSAQLTAAPYRTT